MSSYSQLVASMEEEVNEVVENANGGKQTRIHGAYNLLPFASIEEAAKVLEKGAMKYGVDNWKLITVGEHLNHAYKHIALAAELSHTKGDVVSDLLIQLSHALVRTMFAIDRLKDSQCKTNLASVGMTGETETWEVEYPMCCHQTGMTPQ